MKVYQQNDKNFLYWLIDLYIKNEISVDSFCTNFHRSFVIELDSNEFSEDEYRVLCEVNDMSSRYATDEKDFALWSGFVTKQELRERVVLARAELKEIGCCPKLQ